LRGGRGDFLFFGGEISSSFNSTNGLIIVLVFVLCFGVATIDSNMSSILCPSTDSERSLFGSGEDASTSTARFFISSSNITNPLRLLLDLGERLLILNLLLLLLLLDLFLELASGEVVSTIIFRNVFPGL
jgi:hypothetical protein